ncbi:MAG: hypothetical protein BWX80_02726 [Candidatus Hydrogenedentes bacterium ADurb.Bin101]|nr:MAG: hypothetical protein BWX80_02726 [Candidatus Hydrogenedentes bacterium ADurb.Bin101]
MLMIFVLVTAQGQHAQRLGITAPVFPRVGAFIIIGKYKDGIAPVVVKVNDFRRGIGAAAFRGVGMQIGFVLTGSCPIHTLVGVDESHCFLCKGHTRRHTQEHQYSGTGKNGTVRDFWGNNREHKQVSLRGMGTCFT